MKKNERWGQWHYPMGDQPIDKAVELECSTGAREFALYCDNRIVAILRESESGRDYFNPDQKAVVKERQPQWHRLVTGERVKSLGCRAQIKQEGGFLMIRFLQRR